MKTLFARFDRAIGTTSDERICNLVSLILAGVMPILFALASGGTH